ncbi:MAG: hypothetical protein AAGA41_11260 [Pseudomonadota bacterium]
MLAELQQQHCDTYGVAGYPDVRDYLITSAAVAEAVARESLLAGTHETLLLAQDDDGLALSLFLDAALLERLEATDPLGTLKPRALADFWQVVEGISHFNTVVHRAHHDRRVSLLELELQAEVDKFVASLQRALAQGDTALARNIHGWLFGAVSFHSDLEGDALDRYRAANDFAGRFCARLADAMIRDVDDAQAELRRFFRLPAADKISHINTRCM